MALLEIAGLRVEFPSRFGVLAAVDDYDLTVERGEIHGLVGESGAGKSTIGAAVLGLLPGTGHIAAGTIKLDGEALTGLAPDAWHRLRGNRISMIFQDPQTSLNPLLTIEEQLVETIRAHRPLSGPEALAEAIRALEEVGIRDAAARLGDYPHQFSGGMRQRVVIALALASEPDLIIADEPTTALDVSVQKQVLTLIRQLAKERGVGVLLVTHDMGVIAEITDRVSVLLDGRCVEAGPTGDVLGRPMEPYTRSLIASVPRLDRRVARFPGVLSRKTPASGGPDVAGASAEFASDWLLGAEADAEAAEGGLIEVEGLSVTFSSRRSMFEARRELHAAQNVRFEIGRGETLGLVGESGSGKSTVAKAIVGIHRAKGSVRLLGRDLPVNAARARDDASRRQIQMIFQDPYSSLDNRWRVGDIIGEPLRAYGLAQGKEDIRRIAASMLSLVGLPQAAIHRYPHQFSGGQRQRIAIARALVARPLLLICDEPTSALDVSVQAQVLNLLKDLQARFGLGILFISHDLPVVRQMANDIAVMRNGEIVEAGDVETFFAGPTHDYSRMLLAEMPSLELLGDPETLTASMTPGNETPA